MQFDVEAISRAIRYLMEQGLSYEEAARRVRESTANAAGVLDAPGRMVRSAVSGSPDATGQDVLVAAGLAPQGAESLADGLAGAPQDDITPEPIAGSPSRAAVMNNTPPAAAPSRPAGPGDSPLAPPHVMTQADIDYVNSLPQNSPEAKAARQRRYDEEDARMADAEGRLDQDRARLAALREGGVPSSFDPGTLDDDERLPGVSSARPQSYANPNTFDPMAADDPRQAFRDFERAEDMRRRSSGVPVEAQRERDFASGQLGDFDERMAAQSRFAQAAQFDPNGEFGPNDFQRRYNPQATAEWNQRMQEKIRQGARKSDITNESYNSAEEKIAAEQAARAKDAKYQERAQMAELRKRAVLDAKALGMTYEQVVESYDEYAALRGDSARNAAFAGKRVANLNSRDSEQALRRERLATRHLLGVSQPQANAFLMLSPEDRNRAVNYITNPMAARIDLAMASRDGQQFDPLQQNAMSMQRHAAYTEGYGRAQERDSGNGGMFGPAAPKNAREWEDRRDEIIGSESPGSPGYEGALRYFEQKYGRTPPEAAEEEVPSWKQGPKPTQSNGIQIR